jgi:hypothetical protein
MPLRYDIDSTKAHVHIIGTDRVTMPEMVEAVDRVAVDRRFCSHFTVIFDLRDAEYTAELNDGNVFVAALKRRQDNFQGRFALLLPASLQVLGSLYCLLAEVAGIDRMKCFTAVDEARKWCGLPE